MNTRLMTSRSLLVAAACASAALTLTPVARAQTGYTITGGMSNFDCTNRCDVPCDEMEIDIEGIHPEDVVHTYRNGNYGSPTVTLSQSGTYTIIDYRNPGHLTAVNTIEHFGVSLAPGAGGPNHPVRVRWFRSGQPAPVNGHIPDGTGGATAPATQPMLPAIHGVISPGSHGQGGVVLTVANNDPVQAIWIKRRARISTGEVTLEALMPNNPVVVTSLQLDPSPVFLGPGQSISTATDLVELEGTQSAVFSAEYYQNLASSGPFTQNYPGPALGNIMTATIASPRLPCAHSVPTIVQQPASVEQAADTRVDLRVTGRGDDLTPLTYQWMKEGVSIVDDSNFVGTTTGHLRINRLTAATEGFYSVRITNTCASIVSNSALVFITGHNAAPVRAMVCPTIAVQPASMVDCWPSGGCTLVVGANGSDTLSYQWQCLAAGSAPCGDLVDGAYSDPATGLSFIVAGATGPSLTVRSINLGSHAPQLFFAVRVSNACGSVTSDAAILTVVPPCSVADLPLGGLCPDGTVDGADFVAFINSFAIGDVTLDAMADVNADGTIDGNDFVEFINAFAVGC